MGNLFKNEQKIRLGIWGLGRGATFLELCKDLNIEVVAGCDYSEFMRNDFKKVCPEAFVTADEDEFLAQDMDAVLVATYFFTHSRDSIKVLESGKHVLCEVASFFTPAEGVKLAEAVEKSGRIYCMAENYTNHFVRKLWQDGVFGELAYAEFSYVHNCRPLSYSTVTFDPLIPGNTAHSWRSWLNWHYYCTHSLGAAMETTGTRPVKVYAPLFADDTAIPGFLPGGQMDRMAPSFVTMDNGGVIRNMMGTSTADDHSKRIWGTRAYIDLTDPNSIMAAVGQCGNSTRIKLTPPRDELTELAAQAGHGGGDFWVLYHFADSIRHGTKNYWDIYAACDVTLTGIMAVKSQSEGGIPVEVPDFRDKAVREKYRNDHFAQKHFDPKKIFPEDQVLNLTKHFSSIMNALDKRGLHGVSLLIAALDGMKLYKYITHEPSRVAVQTRVREVLRELPAMVDSFRQADELAKKYPDSPGGKALRSMLDSAYPEKMADPAALKAELIAWLAGVDIPCLPQLKMCLDPKNIQKAVIPAVPEEFCLRKFHSGDEKAYTDLMRRAGWDNWGELYLKSCLDHVLGDGIFFLEEIATGKIAATAMANKAHGDEGGELGWVAVDPDYRGHHFAEIVCSAAVDHFRKAGYTHLYLFTDDFRAAAIRIYLKEGWQPVIRDAETCGCWDKVCKRLNWQMKLPDFRN